MRSSATGSARRRSGRSRTCSSSASGRARTGPSASGTGAGRTSGPSPSTVCSRTSRARSARARPVSPWAVRDRAAGPPCPARRIRRLTTRSASISQAKEIRINEGIRVREVRVVGADGAQLGVMPIQQALETARQQELDLVEVAPEAQPPVCRIMDFGKYKYTQARRLKEARKKQTTILVKEVKMGPKTEKHDFDFKHKLEKKRPARRRRLRGAKLIDKVDERRLKVLVPYL